MDALKAQLLVNFPSETLLRVLNAFTFAPPPPDLCMSHVIVPQSFVLALDNMEGIPR